MPLWAFDLALQRHIFFSIQVFTWVCRTAKVEELPGKWEWYFAVLIQSRWWSWQEQQGVSLEPPRGRPDRHGRSLPQGGWHNGAAVGRGGLSLSHQTHDEGSSHWRLLCLASRLWVSYSTCVLVLKIVFIFHSRYWYNNGCLFPDMGTVFIAIDKCTTENGCLKVEKEGGDTIAIKSSPRAHIPIPRMSESCGLRLPSPDDAQCNIAELLSTCSSISDRFTSKIMQRILLSKQGNSCSICIHS